MASRERSMFLATHAHTHAQARRGREGREETRAECACVCVWGQGRGHMLPSLQDRCQDDEDEKRERMLEREGYVHEHAAADIFNEHKHSTYPTVREEAATMTAAAGKSFEPRNSHTHVHTWEGTQKDLMDRIFFFFAALVLVLLSLVLSSSFWFLRSTCSLRHRSPSTRSSLVPGS